MCILFTLHQRSDFRWRESPKGQHLNAGKSQVVFRCSHGDLPFEATVMGTVILSITIKPGLLALSVRTS
jgi:hypothetical protein